MTYPAAQPLERFEEVSGRSVFVLGAGRGSPAVVFEAGVEDFSRAWHPVQKEIAKETRTFAYDRAGCGQSEWASLGRTCGDLADDFAVLTDKLALSEPFILVAHSLGGLIARLFAVRHPERLAGIVLVDSVQEDFVRLEPEIYREAELPPPPLRRTALAHHLPELPGAAPRPGLSRQPAKPRRHRLRALL